VAELAGARAAAPRGARRRTGCGSLWSSRGVGAASPRPSPHLRATRGRAPCGWEWEHPTARAAAPVAKAHRCARDSLHTELAGGSLRTELAGGQGFTPRGQVRELTGGAGRRSPAARKRSFRRRSWWPTGKISGLLQVYVVCVGDVSEECCNVSCECCKSGSRSCDVVTIFRHMLYMY
jgi:hypothetical protein